MKRIAVAALSARALAQAAAREGFEVIALDVFGDADTRRAALQWRSIGAPAAGGGWRIDAALLFGALDDLARSDRVEGWIVGAGFEAEPELIEAGARRLPLIGNGAGTLRRLHNARAFFAALDAQRVPHPPVRHDWPDQTDGWLHKDFAGSGGWQVRRARDLPPHPLCATQYLQQERHGALPMSATFVADGLRARVLGFNRQLSGAIGGRPYVWRGVIAGLPLADAPAAQVDAALHALVPAFGLRGLGSLDFLRFDEDGRIEVLELNARVPASAQLHAAAGVRTIDAHVSACVHGVLPASAAPIAPRGVAVVFAPREMHVGDSAARWLAAQPEAYDIPAQATRFRAGDPVCSVGATGAEAAEVQALLLQRASTLLVGLESFE